MKTEQLAHFWFRDERNTMLVRATAYTHRAAAPDMFLVRVIFNNEDDLHNVTKERALEIANDAIDRFVEELYEQRCSDHK